MLPASSTETGNVANNARPIAGSATTRLALFLCLAILAVKTLLIARINVNWDEFYYLSRLHAFSRGELADIFQLSYVHLFAWLPKVATNEMTQILAGRTVMIALLFATVALIAKLASRLASPTAVWIAPLAYLAASPVLMHGGSFRADSLLAPLTVALLIPLTSADAGTRNSIFAGILLGIAGAVTVKAVLIVPLVAGIVLANGPDKSGSAAAHWRVAVGRLAVIGLVSACVAGVLLALHALALPDAPAQTVQGFASSTARTTILENEFFPRWDYFRASLDRDRITWLFIVAGAIAAAARRSSASVLLLSLLPLLFYRNAFPYYYVVMLAPASVLAAIAVDSIRSLAAVDSNQRMGAWVPLALTIPLAMQAGVNLYEIRHDDQERQRVLISAVHQVFPSPVAYIDHSGMIATFRKANFFMSSLGIENYRKQGSSFMRSAPADDVPLLLVNRAVLDPDSEAFQQLLAEDREFIDQYYLPYWGPIRVAGGQVEDLPAGGSAQLLVPFRGRYRLETESPILVDNVLRRDGDTIEISDPLAVTITSVSTAPESTRLVWAAAEPPPSTPWIPFWSIYTGL